MRMRQGPVYEMVIAKGGLKMQPAEPAPAVSGTGDAPSATASGLPPGISLGKDDTAVLAPGFPNWIIEAVDATTTRLAARMQGVPELIRIMERESGRTVRDKTGLSGKYDFDFTFTHPAGLATPWDLSPAHPADTASDPGADFFAAIQSRLGLKLVPKKGPVEMLVVDRWNKLPTGN